MFVVPGTGRMYLLGSLPYNLSLALVAIAGRLLGMREDIEYHLFATWHLGTRPRRRLGKNKKPK
jgi:hypothetical protein